MKERIQQVKRLSIFWWRELVRGIYLGLSFNDNWLTENNCSAFLPVYPESLFHSLLNCPWAGHTNCGQNKDETELQDSFE